MKLTYVTRREEEREEGAEGGAENEEGITSGPRRADDGKIFGRRANFHSTVNTRRAEAEKLVRERRK